MQWDHQTSTLSPINPHRCNFMSSYSRKVYLPRESSEPMLVVRCGEEDDFDPSFGSPSNSRPLAGGEPRRQVTPCGTVLSISCCTVPYRITPLFRGLASTNPSVLNGARGTRNEKRTKRTVDSRTEEALIRWLAGTMLRRVRSLVSPVAGSGGPGSN
jgi:hypothetical protein